MPINNRIRTCCLCENDCIEGYHMAQPLKKGVCCTECYTTKVIPASIDVAKYDIKNAKENIKYIKSRIKSLRWLAKHPERLMITYK